MAHRFAMSKVPVVSDSFESMANCVTEVQNRTIVGLALVALNDHRLERAATVYDVPQQLCIESEDAF